MKRVRLVQTSNNLTQGRFTQVLSQNRKRVKFWVFNTDLNDYLRLYFSAMVPPNSAFTPATPQMEALILPALTGGNLSYFLIEGPEAQNELFIWSNSVTARYCILESIEDDSGMM